MTNLQKWVDRSGKKQVRGSVHLGKGEYLDIDSSRNIGIQTILDRLDQFICYQPNKFKFPMSSAEDTIQDIRLIAIEGIPNYDDQRNISIVNFLKGHIKNRLVNKCKFYAQARRRATHGINGIVKARCPCCKKTIRCNRAKNYHCPSCNFSGVGWRVYNMPVFPIPASAIKLSLDDECDIDILDSVSEDGGLNSIVGFSPINDQDLLEAKNNIYGKWDSFDEVSRGVIDAVLSGGRVKDAYRSAGLSEVQMNLHFKELLLKINL